ncbi:MAG: hypothetical protein C5B50_10595 [Verrucomicrobia bacterium]|nr:MAG: hypothetical protein C5B50_10595 [Verrucomicrobiota bacterium]
MTNPPVWKEGVQYVRFRNVQVAAGQALVLTVRPGTFGYAVISGFQILQTGTGSSGVPPSITQQPANQTVVAGGNASFSVGAVGSVPLSYQWSFNGSNVAGATGASLSLSNVQSAQAGSYAVLVSNAYGSASSSNAVLTVGIPPSITTQPHGQSVTVGSNVTFTVQATGTSPLAYQWQYNNGILGGATGTALSLVNVQTWQAGTYSVLVSNTFGARTSSNAVLTVTVPPTPALLFNVDFNAGVTHSLKTGFAAIGQATNDFWNLYSRDNGSGGYLTFGTVTNMSAADGTHTQVGMTVANAPGAYSCGSTDPMYNTYLYPQNGGNITVTVTNLPSAIYNVLPYSYDGKYTLTVGGTNYGTRASHEASVASPPVWTEGIQYARYTNVLVISGQALTLTVQPGVYGYSTIAGLQLNTIGRAPVANNISASYQMNQPLVLSLAKILMFCSDPDGLPLNVSSVTGTSTNGGSVTLGTNAVTYTPGANFTGADRFTYTVSDGRGLTASAFVLVTAQPSSQISGNMLPLIPITGGFQVRFMGVPGNSYGLQRAPSTSGPWTTIATVISDSNGLGSFDDTSAPQGGAFYRTTHP